MNYNELRNGFPYLPKEQRKTILLSSDDIRTPSGIGTMSREIVLGTCHYYNWVQIGAAIKHPDVGKIVDLSGEVSKEVGISDANVIIYPFDGYGDDNIVRMLMTNHKVSAFLHYTDPRFFYWLYQTEHEIRQEIPIFYYCIWDDCPPPMWNAPFYASCNLLMGISKQSYSLHKHVLERVNCDVEEIIEYDAKINTDENDIDIFNMGKIGKKNRDGRKYKYVENSVLLSYIPHGINENYFYPIEEFNKTHELKQLVEENGQKKESIMIKNDKEILQDLKEKFFGNDIPEFVVLYVNRNIRRKQPGDVVLAYKYFCDMLSKEEAKKVCMIMHTQPIDENGTNLIEVVNELCPNYRVVFSDMRLEPIFMNVIHNIGDVCINLSSNEGFGLGTCESMMSGNVIVVNVTGGLQDQCGFKLRGNVLNQLDYSNIVSLHNEDKWKDNKDLTYGDWAFPIWPTSMSPQGSPWTPYIYDDRCKWQDAGQKIKDVYDLGKEEIKRRGLLARQYVLDNEVGMSASEMSRRFMSNMDKGLSKFIKRKRFSIYQS